MGFKLMMSGISIYSRDIQLAARGPTFLVAPWAYEFKKTYFFFMSTITTVRESRSFTAIAMLTLVAWGVFTY